MPENSDNTVQQSPAVQPLPALVSVDWLAANRHQPDLVILDASWHMPGEARDGEQEWLQRRIPGAQFFDFDHKVCQTDTDLPHMMPTAEVFEREVRELGINRNSRIVIYDALGVFTSPRGWWMFRAMGHDQVAVLNGGLPAWRAAGLPLESGEPVTQTEKPAAGNFIARSQPGLFCNAAAVQQALDSDNELVLDARAPERFNGLVAEPRPHLRRGHMPGALNLPFVELLDEHNGLMPPDEIRAVFAETGITDPEQAMLFSCGSGITACVLALGAELAGFKQLSVYDGSWTEWGQPDSDLPVVT